MKYNNPYDRPTTCGRKISTPSITQQCFKAECDVNEIVRRPNMGINPFNRPTSQAQYGDFTQSNDFHEAMNIICKASQQFESLPSNIRQRFNNEPMKFLEFVNDPKNIEEGVKLGIYEKSALRHLNKTDQPKSSLDIAYDCRRLLHDQAVSEQAVSQPIQSTSAESSAQ